MASITSPEQGAQHECSNTFLWSPGGMRWGRVVSFISESNFRVNNAEISKVDERPDDKMRKFDTPTGWLARFGVMEIIYQ